MFPTLRIVTCAAALGLAAATLSIGSAAGAEPSPEPLTAAIGTPTLLGGPARFTAELPVVCAGPGPGRCAIALQLTTARGGRLLGRASTLVEAGRFGVLDIVLSRRESRRVRDGRLAVRMSLTTRAADEPPIRWTQAATLRRALPPAL